METNQGFQSRQSEEGNLEAVEEDKSTNIEAEDPTASSPFPSFFNVGFPALGKLYIYLCSHPVNMKQVLPAQEPRLKRLTAAVCNWRGMAQRKLALTAFSNFLGTHYPDMSEICTG